MNINDEAKETFKCCNPDGLCDSPLQCATSGRCCSCPTSSPAMFTVKDSGQRQQFDGGMVRDVETDKTDYTFILDGPMFDRWAEHMTKGAKKYGDRNWMKANGQEELARFRRSALRHMRQWLRGDQDEDHASAVFFNINAYEWLKAKLNTV